MLFSIFYSLYHEVAAKRIMLIWALFCINSETSRSPGNCFLDLLKVRQLKKSQYPTVKFQHPGNTHINSAGSIQGFMTKGVPWDLLILSPSHLSDLNLLIILERLSRERRENVCACVELISVLVLICLYQQYGFKYSSKLVTEINATIFNSPRSKTASLFIILFYWKS